MAEVTLDDLAKKGKTKLSKKIPRMPDSYRKAKSRAITNYKKMPFGPTRKANYESAWEYMPDNYELKVKPGLEDKWARNWKAKMAE